MSKKKETTAIVEPTKEEKLAKIKKLVIKRTLEGKIVSEDENVDDEDKVFKAKLNSVFEKADFGCQEAHVKRVVEILASEIKGRKITIKESVSSMGNAYLAVVPLKTKVTGHNYPFDLPCIIGLESPDMAITMNADIGNHLPMEDFPSDYLRPATLEEIEKFFKVIEVIEGEDSVLEFFSDGATSL